MERFKLSANTRPEKSPVEAFMYRYMPYWPLFLILVLVAGGLSIFYLKFLAKPTYEISAKLIVEDEKKGVDEAKILQALNISSNTIVDNEIEVIQSKQLLRDVVDSQHLYAPVSVQSTFTNFSAYKISPVIVEFREPDNIDPTDDIIFVYHKNDNKVTIGRYSYPVGQWVKTNIGELRFLPNPHTKNRADGIYSFALDNPKAVVESLFSRLLITPASKLSSVILISFKDEVPQRGEEVVNGLIRAYYHSAKNSREMLAENTLSFVQSRIGSVAHELDSIENKLKTFRNTQGVVNLGEQSKMYLDNVGANDNKISDIDMQLAMLDQVERYVQNKDDEIGIVPSMAGLKDQQMLATLVNKLYESQMEYERLKKTVPAGNPAMFSLKNEIDNMRPSVLEHIKNQRQSLAAGKFSLTEGSNRYVSMLNSIPAKEKQLLDITRQQAIKNDAYSFLLQKREEATLAYSSMNGNGETVSHATATYDPVGPKKMFVYSASFVFALLFGFGFVNLKESGTNKVLFRTDIERITNLPIVGEIMRIKGKHPLFLNAENVEQLASIEQFRQLRFALGLNSRVHSMRKLLITSSEAAEGKSFICNNLALSITSCGKKVVLVDFDFRNPKTSAAFGLAGRNGLTEYFAGDVKQVEDIIYSSDIDNLFVIPAGNMAANPSELLLQQDLDELFMQLENRFDFVVMDTAPVAPVIDASIISQYCDAILFVVRHGRTSKATLESIQKSQKMNGSKNMFIVFNAIKSRGFLNNKYGFGYGYGINRMYGNEIYQQNSKRLLAKKV